MVIRGDYIAKELPVVIELDRLDLEDLPDCYEEVQRREQDGYSVRGVRQKKWQSYAVRPLTGRELKLLEEAHDTVLQEKDHE